MGVHNLDVYPEVKRLLGIPEDEEIFILRQQDKAAHPTLNDYAFNAEGVKASDEFVNAVYDTHERWLKWWKENPHRMKVPD